MDLLREILGVWALLGMWLLLGTITSPRRWHRPFEMTHTAESLATGFVLMAGGVSAASGSIAALPALLLMACAGWEWRGYRKSRASADEFSTHDCKQAVTSIALLAAAAIIGWFIVRHTTWPPMSGGRVGIPHADYGFWSLLSRELIDTKTESYWTASLGHLVTETGGGGESWYHWWPFWIAGLAGKLFHAEPLPALLGIAAPALFVVAWTAAAAAACILTPVGGIKAWLAGLAAMIAAAYPTYSCGAGHWLPLLSADQTHEHARYAIVQNLAYWPDFALLLQALLAGWRGRRRESCIWVGVAAAGSPQACAFVLMGCASLAVLSFFRACQWWRKEMVAAGVVASIAFVLGRLLYGGVVGQGPMFRTGLAEWVTATRHLSIDLATATVLNTPIMWAAAMVAWRERKQPCGPLALASLCAAALGYAGYRWLLPRGDNTHFLAYGTAVIAWPLGWLLLLRSALDEKPSSLRAAAAGCAAFSLVCGGADVTSFASKMVSQMPKVDQKAASKMRSRLAGRTIGYFAGIGGDRVWWLSKYSSWGALLDCRIVRLDVVPVAENYAQFERQYGPPALLGGRFADVKADPVALGISLTRAMDIRVIAQPEGTRVPSPLRPGLRKIGVLDGMTFFELKGDETGTTSP